MNLSRKPAHFIVAVATFVSFVVPSYAQQAAPSAAARAPIKIGVLLPITGPWALASKDVQDGHALYLEKIGGTVAGRKIELIVEDTEAKGDVAITKARKLVEKDNVDIVAGLINSAECYAVAPYLAEKKVMTIVTGNCGAEGLTKDPKLRSPYIWRTTQSAGMLVYPMAEYLLKNNMRRVALVFSAYAGGYEVVDSFARAYIEGGGTIIQEIYPALGTTDFGPFMAQIKQDADALVTFIVGTDGLRFAQQYSEYGLKAKLPLMDVAEVMVGGPNLIQLKDAAVGVISSIHYAQDNNSPENKDFLQRFEAKYKDRLLSAEVAGGYAGMHIITTALRAVGGNVKDTQKLHAAFKGLHITTAKGSFSFDDYQNVVEDFYIKRVEKTADGKYVYKTLYKIPNVSQFWTWRPEDVLKFPYGKLHGKYTNINKTQLEALIKSASN
jgi:branched-chain amino acid transport system substrate-binding protein